MPAEQVLWFASEDGITKLITAGGHAWMQPTLNDLEERLDPSAFFRVSRAAIVRLDAVREVHPQPGGNAVVTLSDGTKLEASRRRLASLMVKLAG